jgi:hypothetical protein
MSGTREEPDLEAIKRRICEIAPSLHTAGTFPARTFDAILRHAVQKPIRNSAETGSGASTLLFSHVSEKHTVFALDDNSGSVVNVRRSPLLRADRVTFIEGPTQQTLLRHRFADKLQLALIDGPHAYPFPDLEYYFLYPHLDTGALLILDDIHIRSVHNLFEFLRRDAMFDLVEVVGSTAFFRRTAAPVFNPLGDGWPEQGYNKKPLLQYVWRESARNLIPSPLRNGLQRWRRSKKIRSSRGLIEILSPRHSESVGATGIVEGLTPGGRRRDARLWMLARRRDMPGWWPQGDGPIPIEQTQWKVEVNYGEPHDAGHDFELAALLVGPTTNEIWMEWVNRARHSPAAPPVQLPPPQYVFAEAYRTVRKAL